MNNTQTEVAVRKTDEIAVYSRLPDPIAAVKTLGTIFLRSTMFNVTREEQAQCLAWFCLVENLSPMALLRDYHIMDDGKLSKKAVAAFADFRRRGGKHKWIKTGMEQTAKEDDRTAELELTYENQTIRVSYSVGQAKAAGCNFKAGGGWARRPENMLRARCLTIGIPMLAPEIYAGEDVEEPEYSPRPPGPATEPSANTATVESDKPKREKPAKEKPSQPVAEAEVVSETKKPEPAKPAEPAQAAQPAQPAAAQAQEPTKQAEPPKEAKTAEGKLPEAVVAQLEACIGIHSPAAMKWLLKKGWVTPEHVQSGEPLAYLTEARAKQIIDATPAFIKAVNSVS